MSNIIHSLKDKLTHHHEHNETASNAHSHPQAAPSTGVVAESAVLSGSGRSHPVEHDVHQGRLDHDDLSTEQRSPNNSHNGPHPTRLTNNPADAMNNSGVQPFIAKDPYYSPDKHHPQVSQAVPEPSPMTINDNTMARQSEMAFRK
ncbi:hypothetical protein CPB83DRAFT_911490 [Crepidotus variabilis]|uniref:Uncharacterized protein n=1 Tax=Crepidotus variabilis TaxID=179855 RepID=A0A9P6JIC0_9AGAR|nr:hypothetical protein CPB83DRAFT_911490 [Crepidotus variabilis]